MQIIVTDIHNNDHEFDEEQLSIECEGTLVKLLLPTGPRAENVLAVFANPAAVVRGDLD